MSRKRRFLKHGDYINKFRLTWSRKIIGLDVDLILWMDHIFRLAYNDIEIDGASFYP